MDYSNRRKWFSPTYENWSITSEHSPVSGGIWLSGPGRCWWLFQHRHL